MWRSIKRTVSTLFAYRVYFTCFFFFAVVIRRGDFYHMPRFTWRKLWTKWLIDGQFTSCKRLTWWSVVTQMTECCWGSWMWNSRGAHVDSFSALLMVVVWLWCVEVTPPRLRLVLERSNPDLHFTLRFLPFNCWVFFIFFFSLPHWQPSAAVLWPHVSLKPLFRQCRPMYSACYLYSISWRHVLPAWVRPKSALNGGVHPSLLTFSFASWYHGAVQDITWKYLLILFGKYDAGKKKPCPCNYITDS